MPGVLDAARPAGGARRRRCSASSPAISREGAALKLRSGGIDPARFRVGAYGSDAAHRPDLPPIAARRAAAALRPGADRRRKSSSSATRRPTSPAAPASPPARSRVATGSYAVADLAACGPHAVFEDLSATDAVVDAIFR